MIWCYLWWVKPSASKVWNLGRWIWIQFVGSSKRTGQEILVASLEYASWIFWAQKTRGGLLAPWRFGTSMMFLDVFTEGHQCLCWIGFLVSETGSVMMQLCMILNLYSSYIYVYRPRGSNMHPPVSSRHVQPQRIHENYLCILDQTGTSLYITKMHDAVQVSVYIYIYIVKFGFIDIVSFDYEQSVPEPHVAFPKCTWWLSRESP